MKQFLFFVIALVATFTSIAQRSGNEVYQNSYNRNRESHSIPAFRAVIIKDSVMEISARVLFNAKADSLLVTLGLSEESKTVKDANAAINKRLSNFKTALKQLGILEADSYVDFITQTKVYDYTIAGNTATQFLKGFEIKKNVIIKMADTNLFDKVIEAASEQEIFDIVKVDYTANNSLSVYTDLLRAASSVINQKKESYLILSPVELLPLPKLTGERFYTVYPGSLYKEYEAFETADVSTDYSRASLIKRVERKAKTFYYDRIDQSDFDLVMNNASPVVGLQYVMEITMQYRLK